MTSPAHSSLTDPAEDDAAWLCDACVAGRCDVCCLQVGGDCECGCVVRVLPLQERLRLLNHPSFAWTQGHGLPGQMPPYPHAASATPADRPMTASATDPASDYREVPAASIRGVNHAQHKSDPLHPRLTTHTGKPHTKTVCGQPSRDTFNRLIHTFEPEAARSCQRCAGIVRAATGTNGRDRLRMQIDVTISAHEPAGPAERIDRG